MASPRVFEKELLRVWSINRAATGLVTNLAPPPKRVLGGWLGSRLGLRFHPGAEGFSHGVKFGFDVADWLEGNFGHPGFG